MTTATVNGLGQVNNTIQSHDIGNHLVAAFVSDQPGSVVNVTGIGNVVDVIDSPDSIIRLTGINNVATTYSADTMAFLNGVANSVLITRIDDTVNVLGVHNEIELSGTTQGAVVVDHGLGTIFNMDDSTNLTIRDFANDPTGTVKLYGITPAQAVAAEQSDGHGGTLLSFLSPSEAPFGFPATTIDFVGDPHVAMSHFA
jgi:hypothetical protein